LYEHPNTNNNFLRATFTSVCNKHFLGHMKLFKNFSLPSGPLRLAERWPPSWFAGPCLSQLQSADEIMCRVCSMQLAWLWKVR